MKLKLDDYKEKEDNLRKRETELSTSLSRFQELEDCPLSVAQIKSILHKMNGIVVPNVAFEFGNKELDGSAHVTKFFYVIDSFDGPMKQVSSLSLEKEELQSTIEKRNLEIEFMKRARGTSNTIPLVASAAHARTTRKGSSDHLAINIDAESEQLITSNESDEDKGHIFKFLNTSGLIPRPWRITADRIDGFWISGSRALMSHPRGRLGLVSYCLFLHIWLLGTIL